MQSLTTAARGAQIILEVAEERFATAGFDGVSINEIARLAGVSKANIFHHFGSKEGLYLAVMRDAVARAAGMLAAEAPPDAGGPRAHLESFFGDHLQVLLQAPKATRLILRELLESSSATAKALAEEVFAGYFSRLVGWVRSAQNAGELRQGLDPSLFAFLLISANVHFFQALPVLQHLPEAGFAGDPGEYGRQVFALLMGGAAPPMEGHPDA